MGLCPPKILFQYIIYKRINVDVIVRAVPQIEHIPVLQAARKFRRESVVNRRSIRDVHFEVRHKAAFQEVESWNFQMLIFQI